MSDLRDRAPELHDLLVSRFKWALNSMRALDQVESETKEKAAAHAAAAAMDVFLLNRRV